MASLPDKWIRKAIYDAINNMVVDTITFPCYTEQTGGYSGNYYTLLSTQLNSSSETKCGRGWINDTEVQVIVRVPKNQGSKLLIDNATDAVITALDSLTLDAGSGMKINDREVNIANEFSDETTSQIIYRKIVRLTSEIT